MIYGELGIMPLLTEIQARIISFWAKLIENTENHYKLSSEVYNVIYELYIINNIKSNWIDNIKKTCYVHLVFQVFGTAKVFLNSKWLINATKQKIKDQYIQK